MVKIRERSNYLTFKKIDHLPRLPLEGNIDVTYRCNNNCRHCWLRIPHDSQEKKRELSFDEIRHIVDEAKKTGCRKWSISGGEPMLRPDFPEIFDYITTNSRTYSINTNGTLITHKIADLLKRKGTKMVALYGATANVHDHITRNPGSFEATMRGFSYLREAGAGFMVQVIPMRDNYHQFQEMIRLAKSLSSRYRIGAAWFYLSAYRDAERNKEIMHQRLDPKDVIELDEPDPSYEESKLEKRGHRYCHLEGDARLFASCISSRCDFHIDPYGQMGFCCYIKDPNLRYDLTKGSFKECWEKFIPSIADKAKGGKEYLDNCAVCESRNDCRWCPVYGYLEHGRFTAKVEYLCSIAKENRKFKERWKAEHRRYYRIAEVTIQVDSDLVIGDSSFHAKFKKFEVDGPGEDTVYIRHHFSLPHLNGQNLGKELYRNPPWAIYKKEDSWIYAGISPQRDNKNFHRIAVFDKDHTHARIYNDGEESFIKGDLHSLTLFPTDQILLARLLADREGCYLHASGVDMNGRGLLFAGHSGTGKSTIVKMLKAKATILCDDRMIVRKTSRRFKIYGTWSHGEVPKVSADSAPLEGIFFLEKFDKNKLTLLEDKKEATKRLLACLIRPFVTVDWWRKTLYIIDEIARETPCYKLYFDKSGGIVDLLKELGGARCERKSG